MGIKYFQLSQMNKIKEKVWVQIFIIHTRYLIGGAFIFASVVKIKGDRFTAESGASNPIDSAWHLFETLYQSGLYWKFIGISQLISGGLLMTQKYAKLGALFNFPIILNIFIITLSYYFAYTPVITGLMLLANLLLLFWDWNEIKIVFNLTPVIENKKKLENDIIWVIIGFLLFLFAICFRAFATKHNIKFWLLGSILVGVIGFIGFIIGLRRRKYYS